VKYVSVNSSLPETVVLPHKMMFALKVEKKI